MRQHLNHLELGALGERLAVQFLQETGLRVFCRNWRCRFGEIDIIARDGNTTAFIEVKTRRGTEYGTPFEAVTVHKRRQLRKLAALWLSYYGCRGVQVRFDVISVLYLDGADDPIITHCRGAF